MPAFPPSPRMYQDWDDDWSLAPDDHGVPEQFLGASREVRPRPSTTTWRDAWDRPTADGPEPSPEVEDLW